MADMTDILNQDPEVLGLQRQRKLADLLTGQAFNQPQGQMISGYYVKPSALQQALPMINAAIGGITNSNLDTKQQDLADALRGKQKEVMQAWSQAKTPQEKFALGTSQYAPKELQTLTYKNLERQKLGAEESIVEPTFDGNGYNTIAQGPGKLSTDVADAAKELKLDRTKIDQWTPQDWANIHQIQAQINNQKRPINNVFNNTGNALGSEFGKTIGEEDASLRKLAKNSQQAVDQADAALKNLPKAITGAGADYRLQAAKVFNVLGASNQDTIKASEQAFSQRSQALLGRVKSSGLAGSQGLTEGERKFLTNAYGGTLNLDESTLRGMLMLEKRIAKKDAENWNTRVKEMPQEVVRGTGVGPVSVPNLGDIDTNNPLLR